MHEERRRSGTNFHPVYSSDEDETASYIYQNSSGKKTRRSWSFHSKAPATGSEYRRKSLVGDKSSSSYFDCQASSENERAAGNEFDALRIPKTIITITAGLAVGVFAAILIVSILQAETPPKLHGTCIIM